MPTLISKKRTTDGKIEERWQVLYTEFTAASTTESLSLTTLPADAAVCQVVGDVVDAFTDAGSISALGLEVGSSGDPNSFLTSYDGFSAGKWHVPGVWETGDGLAVEVKATATGDNLGDGTDTGLDSGEAHIILRYVVTD